MKHSNERPPLMGSDGRDWCVQSGWLKHLFNPPLPKNQPQVAWYMKRPAWPRPETPAASHRGARR